MILDRFTFPAESLTPSNLAVIVAAQILINEERKTGNF